MKIQVTPVGVVSRSCWRTGNAGTTSDCSIAKAPPARARTARMRPGRAAARGASCAVTERTYHKRSVHSASPASVDRPLRRDARENRERILEAAGGAFAELGIDASVEEIAYRANVGMGTLYRRFPTKDALIDAVFEGHLDRIAAAAERALEATAPLGGAARLPLLRRRPAGGRPRPLGDRRRQPPHRATPRAGPQAVAPPGRAPHRSSPGVGRPPPRRRLRGHLGAPLDDRPRRRRDARRGSRVLAAIPRAHGRRATRPQRVALTAATTDSGQAPRCDAPVHAASQPSLRIHTARSRSHVTRRQRSPRATPSPRACARESATPLPPCPRARPGRAAPGSESAGARRRTR